MKLPAPESEIANPLRTVLWQRTDGPGTEWCALGREPSGWRLAGKVLTTVADEPAIVRYEIALADDWATREVRVACRVGTSREDRLRLTADKAHRWQIERDPRSEASEAVERLDTLRGPIDVDLGFSPSTNALPIRRLAPRTGDAVDVTAVWVRFPELTIEPLPQRYVRLAAHRYRYESAGGAFVAEIEVDELGLVVTYEGLWRRTAVADADDN